jgi:predicted signal transduction protein with EAL and GGDEF domain
MLIVVSLLLVTMALSAVMLLVLSSLRHSGARGIREWFAANTMAVVSLPLFAARGAVPDILSVEFANTLLLGTTVMMVAERLRGALERTPEAANGRIEAGYTVSIGVATLDPGESIKTLLSRADAALYAAKAGGRNMVADARAVSSRTA